MNTVAIVGRPNVGKSTLFNQFLRERRSIVDKKPGVTRDRVYGVMERNRKPVILIDTGGLKFSGNEIEKQIRKQVDFALEEADVILLMVDGKEGLTSLDEEISDYIRKKKGLKVIVINKMDRGRDWKVSSEFSRVRLDKTFQISSKTGSGVKHLLDWILSSFEEGEIVKGTTIGVIGRVNTGKSSFVNAVMGYDRAITKEEPGTTRDSINSYLEYNGETIVLVDTAGLKKKSRLKSSLEYYSFLRTIRSIEEADIVLVLIDSTRKVTLQDKRIINWAIKRETLIIILLSKFDLVPLNKEKAVIDYYKKNLSFVDWIPMLPVSSTTMRGVEDSLKFALKIAGSLNEKHPELKEIIRNAVTRRPPPSRRKGVRIYSVKQERGKIWIRTNQPECFDDKYRRYLENRIRQRLKFKGIPISLEVRKGGR
ncbi:MAG: ribosome biogenesis GTPase Der [candidate division WOR-3 bacterium]|nr:ribosome biogenesis GTPase Der [candidate division WOR-3 bacterium]